MKSKITGGDTTLIFTQKVLSKYNVNYYVCNKTGFIQTEEPYWLNEAYNSVITKLDVGLVRRNLEFSSYTAELLVHNFNHDGTFLDFAGGFGLFTRLMRDKGFDFYHTDKFCDNIFAEFHDLKKRGEETQFELITAFEVFEHLNQPLEEIIEILKYSNNILFSTEIIPPDVNTNWWYFSFQTGQHISFYSLDTLRFIADKLKKNFYSNGKNLHLFTEKQFTQNPLIKAEKRDPFIIRKLRKYIKGYDARLNPTVSKTSFIDKDYIEAVKYLNINNG